MSGTGTRYENSILTQRACEDVNSQQYIQQTKNVLQGLIASNNGNVSMLEQTSSSHNALSEIRPPVIDDNGNIFAGLKICVNDLWGAKIEVTSYEVNGSNYSCTLRYVYYDHFGLDSHDVEKYGYASAFRSWYILQHNQEYNGAYRPFLTWIEFDVSLAGSI